MNPLLNETEQAIVDVARSAATEQVAPLAADIDADAECPRDLLAGLIAQADQQASNEQGLLGLALIVEELARASAAVASVVGAHGAASSVLEYCGQGAAAETGSIVILATAAGAFVDAEPSSNGGFRLSGELPLVAGATYADHLLVAGRSETGNSLFLLAANTDGVTIDAEPDLLGLRGSGLATIHVDGVEVPAAAKVGEAAATATAVDTLHVVQAARAVGVAQSALDRALADVGRRRAAGDRVDRSQSIQWMLADIATETEAARVSTWHAATRPPGAELEEAAAGCRLIAAEAAARGARSAVQVFGARGALRSEGVERIYRDAKLMEIEGGTNEEQLRRVAASLLPDIPGA